MIRTFRIGCLLATLLCAFGALPAAATAPADDVPPDSVGDLDTDQDGILNLDDNDIDGDNVINANDADMDGDGVVNAQDPDDDNNGVADNAG